MLEPCTRTYYIELRQCTHALDYRIAGKFRWVNFRYQALKVYFRGLIFVVCSEHVIIAYYLDFRRLNFRFLGLSVTK